jgi:hypothetical protein
MKEPQRGGTSWDPFAKIVSTSAARSVEERPFRAVKRNLLETPFLAPQARAQPKAQRD